MLKRWFQNRVAGYSTALLGVAAVTALCAPFHDQLKDTTVALALVLVVLFSATASGRGPGMLAAALGMMSFKFFFLPPLYELISADPQHWIALAAFIITASTVGHLAVTAKQHAAEAEASRSRARSASVYNRSLIEASLNPIVTIGADGKIDDVNSAAEAVTGHSRAELIGADFSEYFTEREKAHAGYQEVLREGFVRDYPLELRHRDGHVTSVLYSASLYRDDDGNVIGVVATARPVGTYAEKPLGALSDPRVVKGLNRFVTFTSLFAVAVGLLGFAGWTFHITVLKSVIPGRAVITPDTTICFVLIGFALWMLRKKDDPAWPRAKQFCGQTLATLTALAGLMNVIEYVVGWDSGIDRLLFHSTAADAIGGVPAVLLDPITALDFLLLGLALLLLDWEVSWRSRRYWPARFFAFLAGIIAIVGLLDFILGSRISYTHIALQSAVTLLLLAFGLLCARTEQGLGALLASSTVGGTLTRRLLPAAVSIPIVIGVVGWRAFFAGLYSEWSGVSLMIVVSISLLAGFTIWNGYRVDRSDAERRRAEGIIHQREEELREAQRLAQVGSWWWSPKSDSGAWSEQFCRMAGRDPKLPPPSYKEHCGFYTAESAARLDAAVQKAIQTGTPYELDLEMVRTDGAVRSVTSRGEVERDGDGQVVLVRGTVQDVTERKRAESEIRLLARLQSVVAALGGRALGGATLVEMRDDATSQVARELQVDFCEILEILPNREALLLVAGVGWRPGTIGHATVGPGRNSQAGYTLLSDQPVIVEDLPSEKRFARTALLDEHEVVSGITVVVSTSEGPYGILGAHTRRHRTFTTDEVNFLQAVANVLGSFIERQRAEARLWRVNQAQRALSRCNQVLVRASDEATLLQQICDVIVEEAGYRLCWVGRAEHDEAKTVRPLAQAGFEAGYLSIVNITWADSERGQGPTGTSIRTGHTVLSKRIATDPKMMPWRAEALKRGYASSVAIPLVVDSTAFGALMIYAAEPDVFGSEEVALLTELADDLAFGIAALRARSERTRAEEEIRTLNAELEQRVRARTAQLEAANKLKDELILREQAIAVELAQAREREIEIGFRIQQTLLLDQPPSDVPGLRVAALTVPSQRIDGDFYVFIKHQDQALDVIVGDVMGKGIPAALLGAATKSYFLRALGDLMALPGDHRLPEPKEVVMLAHAGVVRHLIELESFVTLCYVRLDVTRRRLDFVDCGHTGIVHLHGSTGVCEIVHGNNLPMGVREGEIYDQTSTPVEPGDLLLLYSDGITEARNTERELFGVERLKEFVRINGQLEPTAFVEALQNEVFAFSQSDRLADDLTSVVIKVEETQLALGRAKLEIPSDLKQLRRAREFVREFCGNSPAPLDAEGVDALELAVNEAASNIMKHAYHGRTNQWIHIEAEAFRGHVSIRLLHLGEPFDPSAAALPALDGSRDSGFGAYMITRSVDAVRYYRDERGRNCVALVKKRIG
jgi:PAS domain S-box-containing protein